MKRVGYFLVVGGCLASSPLLQAAPVAVAVSTSGVTLTDCYNKAREISESVGISAENIRLLQAQYRASLGVILPHVDWIKEQFYQQNLNNDSGGLAGSTLKSTQPESYFQISQPLFSGGRDWAALNIADSMKVQSQFNFKQAEQELLSDVAQAFYAALTAQAQEGNLEDTRRVTQNRLTELDHWVNVGRSLPSDVLSAQTQIATLNAQIEESKRTQMVARETLRFLTTIPDDVPLVDDRPDPQPVPLDQALTRSENRPDLMAQEEALRQSHLNITYAKGAYWPTLGVVGQYFTERVGFESDVRWDATFTLDVPIFEGGINHANVQVARSQDIMTELNLIRLKRSIEQEVRTDQQDLVTLVAVASAYANAADLGQKNYDAQSREYRLGRTSNIEVLQVLTDLQNAKGQAILSKYAAKLSDIQLRIAMGDGL